MKKRILFVCIHNSARSQMAEAFVNHLCPDYFEAHSAGLEPGQLNPYVVQAMQEIGLDLSANQTRSVLDVVRTGKTFAYVIAVCDPVAAERCPIFPGVTQRLHWPFPDPSSATGSHEEKLGFARTVRDQIKARIETWCAEMCVGPVAA